MIKNKEEYLTKTDINLSAGMNPLTVVVFRLV